jgi:hypothetical protein
MQLYLGSEAEVKSTAALTSSCAVLCCSTHQTQYQQQRQRAFVVFLLVGNYSQYYGAFETRVILKEVSTAQEHSKSRPDLKLLRRWSCR